MRMIAVAVLLASLLAMSIAGAARAERTPAAPLDRVLATARLGTLKSLPVPAGSAIDRAWTVDGVFGAGRVRPLGSSERFEDAVLAELAELQFRCSGALDSEFDLPRTVHAAQFTTATLDCHGPHVSVLAVVYILAGNSLVTLLHESTQAHRGAVLDKQARLARALDQAP